MSGEHKHHDQKNRAQRSESAASDTTLPEQMPALAGPTSVFAWQKMIGNQAVQRLLADSASPPPPNLRPHAFNGLPPVRGIQRDAGDVVDDVVDVQNDIHRKHTLSYAIKLGDKFGMEWTGKASLSHAVGEPFKPTETGVDALEGQNKPPKLETEQSRTRKVEKDKDTGKKKLSEAANELKVKLPSGIAGVLAKGFYEGDGLSLGGQIVGEGPAFEMKSTGAPDEKLSENTKGSSLVTVKFQGIGRMEVPEKNIRVDFVLELQGKLTLDKVRELVQKKIGKRAAKWAEKRTAKELAKASQQAARTMQQQTVDALEKGLQEQVDNIKMLKQELYSYRHGTKEFNKANMRVLREQLDHIKAKRFLEQAKSPQMLKAFEEEALEQLSKRGKKTTMRKLLSAPIKKALGTAAAKFIGRQLLKFVPIVNVVMLVVDLVEIGSMLVDIFKHGFKLGGGGGGGGKGGEGEGGEGQEGGTVPGAEPGTPDAGTDEGQQGDADGGDADAGGTVPGGVPDGGTQPPVGDGGTVPTPGGTPGPVPGVPSVPDGVEVNVEAKALKGGGAATIESVRVDEKFNLIIRFKQGADEDIARYAKPDAIVGLEISGETHYWGQPVEMGLAVVYTYQPAYDPADGGGQLVQGGPAPKPGDAGKPTKSGDPGDGKKDKGTGNGDKAQQKQKKESGRVLDITNTDQIERMLKYEFDYALAKPGYENRQYKVVRGKDTLFTGELIGINGEAVGDAKPGEIYKVSLTFLLKKPGPSGDLVEEVSVHVKRYEPTVGLKNLDKFLKTSGWNGTAFEKKKPQTLNDIRTGKPAIKVEPLSYREDPSQNQWTVEVKIVEVLDKQQVEGEQFWKVNDTFPITGQMFRTTSLFTDEQEKQLLGGQVVTRKGGKEYGYQSAKFRVLQHQQKDDITAAAVEVVDIDPPDGLVKVLDQSDQKWIDVGKGQTFVTIFAADKAPAAP